MIPNLTVAYFLKWVGSTMNWKTQEIPGGIPPLPHPWINRCLSKRRWRSKLMILVNAGSDLRFFVRWEGPPGMRMTHHDLQDLYRDLH